MSGRAGMAGSGGGGSGGGGGGVGGWGRTHRSSPRAGSSSSSAMVAGGTVSGLRPPKPPCWRDFVVPPDTRKDHHPALASTLSPPDVRTVTDATSGAGEITDSHSLGGSRLLAQLSAPGGSSKPPKPSKRTRARIHRTRSEHLIDVEELPEGELTVRLADTRPHELKLHVRPVAELDERLYVEENNRRCQSWLASIEAAEPLDDIGYTHSKDAGEAGLEAVDVEVPEETFTWRGEEGEEEHHPLKPPINTSASSSDSDGLLQHVMAAVGYSTNGDDDSDDEDGAISKLGPAGVGRGGNGRGARRGLRATSSSLNVHRKLSSKHILTISEHSGLE